MKSSFEEPTLELEMKKSKYFSRIKNDQETRSEPIWYK